MLLYRIYRLSLPFELSNSKECGWKSINDKHIEVVRLLDFTKCWVTTTIKWHFAYEFYRLHTAWKILLGWNSLMKLSQIIWTTTVKSHCNSFTMPFRLILSPIYVVSLTVYFGRLIHLVAPWIYSRILRMKFGTHIQMAEEKMKSNG